MWGYVCVGVCLRIHVDFGSLSPHFTIPSSFCFSPSVLFYVTVLKKPFHQSLICLLFFFSRSPLGVDEHKDVWTQNCLPSYICCCLVLLKISTVKFSMCKKLNKMFVHKKKSKYTQMLGKC